MEPKIAIVADWLTNYGGAENVVSAMYEAFPKAKIYTTLFNKSKMKDLSNIDIKTSYLQKLPFAKRYHRPFIFQMPHAIETLDLSDYDIVLSSSHSIAKGVITKVETLHICYCHTPMRYCWDDWQNYINQWNIPKFAKNIIFKKIHKLRIWDRVAADRVDYYLANSRCVSKRIKKYYKRDSKVIAPPVDITKYKPIKNPSEDYFLSAGRLVPFKKFDLIVKAFNDLGTKLKIAGTGPELSNLKKLAKKNVEVLGFVSDKELEKLYQNCKAFIFAHTEDAGITPLESMSCGRPVIAYRKGGAKETVKENVTGVFFDNQNIDALKNVIKNFDSKKFNSEEIENYSKKYSREEFIKKLQSVVYEEWENWRKDMVN